jgi:NADH dehydrogenase FAD-containing subunit
MTVPRPDLRRAQPRQAVVAGGGYIGVEMAGALARRGVAVTVVDQAAQPMTTLDPDMGAAVHRAMEGTGIDVRTGTAVTGSETGSNHKIGSVLTGDGSIPADVVVLGLGVRPDTSLARDAGLPLGDHGGLRANVQMQALGHDHIWAGGDCAEVLNLVWGQYQQVALGTRAGFEYVTVTVRSRHEGRLLPRYPADDRQDNRRTPHRTSAGRADRRLPGIGQADRHRCHGALEPDDGRTDDRPGPRVRSAVRASMGPDSRGGTAGRRGSAPSDATRR